MAVEWVYVPEPTLIGFIALPERCANVQFGGGSNSRLFIAATGPVYPQYVNTLGRGRVVHASTVGRR